MKIHGFFGKAPLEAAYIVALFRSKPLAIERRMVFLIDTGALRTTISDRDAIRLGIDYSKLEKHPEGTLGIGGVVETYIAKDVELVFITQDGTQHVEKLETIYILRHKRVNNRIKRIPSILGRDILNKYLLIFDKRHGKVTMSNETK